MNPQKPTTIQVIAVVSSSLIALLLAFAIMWCAIWKIYVEPTMLMLIGTVVGGIGGALTTILVGRSISQLNQPDGETTMTQTTQTVIKPKPQDPAGDLIVTKQPEVAISDKPQPEIKP